MPHSIPDISSLELEAYTINNRVDIVTMWGNMTPQRVADILITHENNPDIWDLLDILFAGYESDEVEELTLPEVAPEQYKYRIDRSEAPTDFCTRVWGKYIRAGILYQDDLHHRKDGKIAWLDPELIPAIYSYCQNTELKPKDYLPPPKSARISKLLDQSPEIRGQYNLFMTAYRRSKLNNPTI